MNRPSGRLVTRLVGVVVVAGAAAALLGALVLWQVGRGALRAEIMERNEVLAQELAARLDTRLDAVVDTLRVAGTREALTRSDQEAEDALRTVLTASALYDELVVYDRAGSPRAAAAMRFLARADDYQARPTLVEGLSDGARPSVLRVGPETPPMLEVAVPLQRPAGTVVGALVAKMPLEVVVTPLRGHEARRAPLRFLVDGEGDVLVHPERDRVAQRQSFPPALEDDRGGDVMVDGVPSLVAVSPLRGLDALVVVQQAEQEALAPVGDQLRQLTVVLLVAIGAIVLAVCVVGTRLLRPLRGLSAAVGRLEHGERGVSVDECQPAELGRLARQLNRMAASLDHRREEVDELHRLSLLLGSRGTEAELVEDVARGAARLLAARGAAVLTGGGEERLAVAAVAGDLGGRAALVEVARRCVRDAAPVSDTSGDDRHLLAVPVCAPGEPPTGVVVLVRDQPAGDAERHLAQTFAAFAGVALQTARRLELERSLVHELQQAVDRKRDFLHGLTHQLLTPLTCIDGFSERLRKADAAMGTHERDRLVTQIQEQTEELEQLLSRLLELAMAERGQRAVSLAPVRLRDAVHGALSTVEHVVGTRPLQVEVPEVEVVADPVLLVRVLADLLSNAAKFSPAGAPVTVRADRSGHEVRIEVIDHGAGIEPDALGRIFEPFWRSETETGLRGGAVGLALVADYVEAMGGRVDVRSTPGQGSTFTVVLEAVRAAVTGQDPS